MFSERKRYVLIPLALICSCSRSPEPSVHRLAVVSLENLSADPSLNWAGRAVAAIVASRIDGNGRVYAFDASDLAGAQARFATQSIHGYLRQTGAGLSAVVVTSNEAKHDVVSTSTYTGANALALADRIARQTGFPVKAYTTDNVNAVRAYFSAFDTDDAEPALRQALAIDPGYGSPYVALAELYARTGRSADVASLIEAARKARFTDLERARMRLLSGQSSGNDRERLAALAELSRLQPGDLQLSRGLIDAAMSAGDFKLALGTCEQVLQLDPESEVALNSAGYAHTFLGNLPAAREAFQRYRAKLPRSANALDSYAEALFYYGQYAEAAPLFLEAHKLNARHAAGHEPVRAALSFHLAGNRTEATRLFEEWVATRKSRGDRFSEIRHDIWRRWTGQQPRTPASSVALSMHSLWALQDGHRDRAASLAQAARSGASEPGARTLANLASLLSQPSGSVELWIQRVGVAMPEQGASRARQQLLGWALLLDGKPKDASRALAAVFQTTPALQNNEERLVLAWALHAAGDREAARKVMPHGFFPPQSVDPGLTAMLFPKSFEVVADLRPSGREPR